MSTSVGAFMRSYSVILLNTEGPYESRNIVTEDSRSSTIVVETWSQGKYVKTQSFSPRLIFQLIRKRN